MYKETDLVRIAKRENNTKRNYLVVNALQGKHIPVKSGAAFEMFEEMADILQEEYKNETLLLIGFAETATAIGAAVATKLGCDYMQTTRENLGDVEYFYFSESHSHATEQKLLREDVIRGYKKADRIVFIEDEVTTGNTILHIVTLLQKEFGRGTKFAVASLLNGMNEEALSVYEKEQIPVHYLVKTNHDSYPEKAEKFQGDGSYVNLEESKSYEGEEKITLLTGRLDARRLVNGKEYKTACAKLWNSLKKEYESEWKNKKNILVLGTEEFMYPALFVARELEAEGYEVRCHSTTRSPIAVSREEEYPLHTRYELKSMYEADRRTFIYDLKKYDYVMILTDALQKKTDGSGRAEAGRKALINALVASGNRTAEIHIFSWSGEPDMPSSYREEDVTLLLKNITGQVAPQPTEERERLIQSGVHYCEMLPIEYVPTEKYMQVYQETLKIYAKETAWAVGVLADKIMKARGEQVVLVSLARAGIPVGILVKHYIEQKYNIKVPHYSISIIRGRGIDEVGMGYLLQKYKPEQLLFVDGWIGKGAILGELQKNLRNYPGVSSEIAVIADPAGVTELCGTHRDVFIASSCLNSTISGLVSRTFLRQDIIGPGDFHGAVYYGELSENDLSYEFLEAIEKEFQMECQEDGIVLQGQGVDEVKALAKSYNIEDINLVKPGIGETTRVLLRRVPWKVLVDEACKSDESVAHVLRLAKEKNVPVEYVKLTHYKCVGLIKKMADA